MNQCAYLYLHPAESGLVPLLGKISRLRTLSPYLGHGPMPIHMSKPEFEPAGSHFKWNADRYRARADGRIGWMEGCERVTAAALTESSEGQ